MSQTATILLVKMTQATPFDRKEPEAPGYQ
jgi:hypothetical protein